MSRSKDLDLRMTDDELDHLVCCEFPYPIAVNYRRLLRITDGRRQTDECFHVFDLGLRAIALGVLSQYCFRDIDLVHDSQLDKDMARRELGRITLGTWVSYLFFSLRAYGGRRDLFFMPELYDLYWNTSREPHTQRAKARHPFQRMVELRNRIVHGPSRPRKEEERQAVGREAMGYLRDVLRLFTFLKHYHLIRLARQAGDEYEYERFTGQNVTRVKEQLQVKGGSLRAGWFYLLDRSERTVLALHPLLVFWFQELEPGGGLEQDAAVFWELTTSAVLYMATVEGKEVKRSDKETVAKFREMIDELKNRSSVPRERVRLTWEGLRQAAEAIKADRMGAVLGRYRRDLYMQRQEIMGEFEAFLSSEKRCFVLTGKSGVGKSSFVLSVADEYSCKGDTILIMYDGARLELRESAEETIRNDLRRYVRLRPVAPKDLFAEIDRCETLDGRKLVVVYDAINENEDGKALLRQIDQMVARATYPWLKVVITSRPQAWRTLKRGIGLAEAIYYRSGGSEDYWVKLEEYTIRMDPFPREELAVVYENYRREYDLQTEYLALHASIREALRDPLMLRLVAEIYEGEVIPDQLRQGDVYDQYLDRLIDSGRLQEQDINLLKQDLVPLMIFEGHYSNRITSSQVAEVPTQDGRPLWDLIRDDSLLAHGERVNDSYVRLVDYEILAETGTYTEYEIAFKYERFYDYYGGRQLQTVLADRADVQTRARVYRNLIERIQDPDPKLACPFLWGPVRRSLILDLEADYDDVIIHLAQTIDQLTKDLIVSALTAHGRDDPDEVESLCLRLLDQGHSERKSPLSRLPSIRPKRKAPTKVTADTLAESYLAGASEAHMAKKAAIEVGYNLRLNDVMKKAALDDSAAARAVAVQHIYYLWRDDHESGFSLLESISEQITEARFLPNRMALESCVGVSLMIIFWHYKDLDNRSQYFSRLQKMWKGPIEHILFLREGEGKSTQRVKDAVREGVLRLAVGLAMAVAKRAEESGVMFGVEDIGAFFPASEKRAELFARLVPHIDAMHEDTGGIGAIRDDLMGLMQDRDMLTAYLAFAVIVASILAQPEQTLALAKEMFEVGMDKPSPPVIEGASAAVPMVTILVWAPRNLLYGRRFTGEGEGQFEIDTDVLDVLGDFVHRFEERYDSWCSTDVSESRFIELGSYTYFHYRAFGDARSELLRYLLGKAVKNNDLDALIRYPAYLSGIGSHPAWGVPRAALQGLRSVLDTIEIMDISEENDLYGSLDTVLVASFANLRAYHSHDVDDFLAELPDNKDTREFRRRIQSRGATESLGMLLGTAGAWFARDVVVDPHPFMRDMLKWLLLQAASSKTLDAWFRLLVKQMINVAYGEPIFDLPDRPDHR